MRIVVSPLWAGARAGAGPYAGSPD